MNASEFRQVGTRYRLDVVTRRDAWARAVEFGLASDHLVRAWFDVAARSEVGRLVDVSGWPVLTTREAFTLARVWGKTLTGFGDALSILGEPMASLALNWHDESRDALIGGPDHPPPSPAGACFESVQLWSNGVLRTMRLASALADRLALWPAAPMIRARALEGLEVLGVHLWKTR